MNKPKIYYVAATGIIIRDGKYLITKRSMLKKAFPGKWTVPGGNLEPLDYKSETKDTKSLFSKLLEDRLKKEIKEEVNLDIKNIGYLTSMTFINHDGNPGIILSYFADYVSGEVKLNIESCDFAWVNVIESKKYDMVEGIYDEIVMLDRLIKEKRLYDWAKEIERKGVRTIE